MRLNPPLPYTLNLFWAAIVSFIIVLKYYCILTYDFNTIGLAPMVRSPVETY